MTSDNRNKREVPSGAERVLTEFFQRRHQGDDVDIEALCEQEPELADVLRSLDAALRSARTGDGDSGETMDVPPPGPGEALSTSDLFTASPVVHPKRVGPYKILDVLGEGGMGVVYQAEQLEPIRRRVALKLIKLGMDTKEVVARFESERQALALMDHPNIAKVYDAGATEYGRPYFVMEYVPGVSITDYCDTHRLDTKERLQLFIQICHALQHAHQKGIIHRDIKPSNILIMWQDGEPVPKIIDFGVAKATNQRLTERTLFTELGQIIGTPEYMSPEQAEMTGLQVDTRTDVYSLGVILYILLVGVFPIDPEELRRGGYSEIRRRIREEDPPKPSTRLTRLQQDSELIAQKRRTSLRSLVRELRGDLDWIILKAMDKDPARRYAAVSELAADVERHLKDEPVIARPPSRVYRFRKFIRKRRGPMAAVVVVVVSLSLGVISLSSAWHKERSMKEALMGALAREAHARSDTRIALDGERKAHEAAQRALQRVKESLSSLFLEKARRDVENGVYQRAAVFAAASLQENETSRARSELCAARRRFPVYPLWASPCGVPARVVAFSPDGTYLATGSVAGGVCLWEVASGRQVAVLGSRTGSITSLCFSPGGTFLAWTCLDGTLRIWRVTSQKEHEARFGLQDHACCVGFRSEEDRLVVGFRNGTIRLCTLGEAEDVVLARRQGSQVTALAVSPDGTVLLSAWGDTTLQSWNLKTRSLVKAIDAHDSRVTCVAYSPDGTRAAAGSKGGAIRVWETATWTEAAYVKGSGSRVASVAFSPDGRHLVSGSDDAIIRLWNGGTGGKLLELEKHEAGISSVAFAPDGTWLASSSLKGTTRLWDVRAGTELAFLGGHTEPCRAVAFSGDGSLLASGSDDATIRLWDAIKGKEVGRLNGHTARVWAVAFNPSGDQLASGSDDITVRLWNVAQRTERRRLDGHAGPVTCLSYDEPGTRLVTGSTDRTVRLWDVDQGDMVATFAGHGSPVTAVAVAPDGRLLASGSDDGEVRLWDVAAKKSLMVVGIHSGRITCLAFTSDGKRIASGSYDDTIRFWAVQTSTLTESNVENEIDCEVGRLRGNGAGITSFAFSPDGMWLVSASRDPILRLWGLAEAEPVAALLGHGGSIASVAFSGDGTRLASASVDRTVRLWKLPSTADIAWLDGHWKSVTAVAFSPDNTYLASGSADATVRLWDLATHREVRQFVKHTAEVSAVTFSPDGTLVASASYDSSLRLWEAETGAEVIGLGVPGSRVFCATFSPAGRRLAACSSAGTVHMWDVPAGRPLAPLETARSWAACVAFSPDGSRMASGCLDGTVQVWNVATKRVCALLEGHGDRVLSVSYSPDGRQLISGSRDRTARVWNAITGEELLCLVGHSLGVNCVAWSPRGEHVASGSSDRTTCVWDSSTGSELARLEGHQGSVTAVAFSRDGRNLASGSSDRRIWLWDLASLLEPSAGILSRVQQEAGLVLNGTEVEPAATNRFTWLTEAEGKREPQPNKRTRF